MVSNYRTTVVSEIDNLDKYLDDWNGLIARTLEDNAYLAPDFLIPALRYNRSSTPFYVVFVYETSGARDLLVGVGAFSVIKPSSRIPCQMISTAITRHSYLASPLVDSEHAKKAIETLWQWLEDQNESWRIINIQKLPNESQTWQLMESAFRKRGRHICKTVMYERPILHRYASFDDYLKNLPRKRRQEYGRLSRKLDKAGEVEICLLLEAAEPTDLANRFMELERKSWKGTTGSALIKEQDDTLFFREIMSNFAQSGKIFMVELKLNNETIAMSCNFIMGKTLFAFKVAYDPAYREYSPGIIAEYEGVRLFHENTELESADSGTGGSSYIRNYWMGRAEIINNYVAMPGSTAVGCLNYLKLGIKAKHTLNRFIESIFSKSR